MSFIFPPKFPWKWKTSFQRQRFSVCVAVRLLRVKSPKDKTWYLLGIWWFLFCFVIISPSTHLPLSTLIRHTHSEGLIKEGRKAGWKTWLLMHGTERRKNLIKARTEEVTCASGQSRQIRCRPTAAPQYPAGDEVDEGFCNVLHQRAADPRDRWRHGVGLWTTIKWCRIDSNACIQVSFHLDYKMLSSLNCFYTFKCYLILKKTAFAEKGL